MGIIVDKVVLFVAGCFVLAARPLGIGEVAAVLAAVFLGTMVLYKQNRMFLLVVSMIYLGGCLFLPVMCFFIPLAAGDWMRQRLWGLMGIAGGVCFYCFRLFTVREGLMVLFCIGVSCLLARSSYMIEGLRQNYRQLRDQSTELNLVLEEKNKNLLEQQDNEIYLATLRERNRIAREIHDNVGHMLSRAILQTAALRTVNMDEVLDEGLGLLKDSLTEAMESIRHSVHDLRDESIDLYQSVRTVMDSFSGYEMNLDYDISEDMPREIKYCFIATVKEALSNISKHSEATQVSIIIREHPALYQLQVEDNGPKKSTSKHRDSGGMGIESMKERVSALGGTVRITSNRGFKIFISIPKKEVNEF